MVRYRIPIDKSLSAEDLRSRAANEPDRRLAKRIQVIAQIVDGKARLRTAEAAGITDVTLRTWIRSYNEFGIEGLRPQPGPGRPPSIGKAQLSDIFETRRNSLSQVDHKLRLTDWVRVIEQETGIRYSLTRVHQLLNSLDVPRSRRRRSSREDKGRSFPQEQA